MMATTKLAALATVSAACDCLGLPRPTYYRWQQQASVNDAHHKKKKHPAALSTNEEKAILAILHSPRFIDKSPGEIYHILLDEGCYLCSERTMYRILTAHNEVRERRKQVRHRDYQKPELLAVRANEVWSWDITKLRSNKKWRYYYLYVILDIFSRYVVGWLVADGESSELAKQFIHQTCEKQSIDAGELTLHADRGASMRSKPVAFLLADLGVTKTHSRPYTSNDNPFSESQFKTLKYCPAFPACFHSIEEAKLFCRDFFDWYNNEHRHSGINRLTPASVHYGFADDILKHRNNVLKIAYDKNPLRFKNKLPTAGKLHEAVWINKPEENIVETIVSDVA